MAAKGTLVVVGSGGREHAITWACSTSPRVGRIIVAPGNAGTSGVINGCPVHNVAASSVAQIVELCKAEKPFLVIVGPEVPLSEGVADALNKEGIDCFGPSQAAAQLESSKAFCKAFMEKHGIPTAKYGAFKAIEEAEAFIRSVGKPMVVKASGLAAGKGVIVPTTVDETISAARSMLVDRAFGDAGAHIVVEELLVGQEASVLAFTDGVTVVPMPAAQDHKRVYEFDAGPNTGGMGAFAPAPLVDPAMMADIVRQVLQPAVDGLRAAGTPYVGVLYAGLMISADRKINALEFNCRLGDPETQVLLPLLQTDLVEVALACVGGKLAATPVHFKKGVCAATVVGVAAGYPGSYAKGAPISIDAGLAASAAVPSATSGTVVFHAGTATAGGQLITSGGRVLAVTSLAPSISAAVKNSYSALERISFPGMFYRRDIAGVYYRPFAQTQPLRIGVLGSTRGTALVPVLEAINSGALTGAQVSVIVSNKSDAGILEKARANGIPAVAVASAGKSREAFDADVAQVLADHNVDLVLMIGFMRIVTPTLVDRYAWRMLNVHPSLLPEFAGGMDLAVHEAVIKAGKEKSGCTVHFVEAAVDAGAILVQKACAVEAGETPETLKAKVQALEGQALVEAVRLFTDDAQVNVLEALRKRRGDWAAVAPLLPASRLSLNVPTPADAGRLTYAAAGVDIDAGDALVENIKPMAKSTARSGADADLGGFGGLFDLKAAGYKDPLLVCGTDGVGTKLKVAMIAEKHDTVGIDLVAMSVNDLVVQGAEPLLFLDYYATGHLDVKEATQVIHGIAEGCRQAGCALIGGETAEMPSMYAHGDYDLAGFAVGAVERDRVLPVMDQLKPGDVLLGIASSGVHSNGFSLVRRVVAKYNVDWHAPPPFPSTQSRLCDEVLTPTKIYIRCLLPSLKEASGCKIKAMAHITGGGLPDNLPRVLRPDLQASIDAKSWPILPVFRWMQALGGGVEPAEMARTFNLGVGMVLVVAAEHVEAVKASVEAAGEKVYRIGTLKEYTDTSKPQVELVNLAEAFAS